VNQEAHEAHLKGLFFWNKRSVESLNLALGYFRQAVEKDPSYAPAYAWMADCYVLLSATQGTGYRTELLQRIKEAGSEALKLDSTLAEAHLVSAVTHLLECDWVGAEKGYKRAIQLSPGNANAAHRYSHFLSLQGRHEEGLAEARRALKLDPISLVINNNLGSSLYFARYYDEAIDQLKEVLRMDPNFPYAHLDLGRVYLQKEMYAEALAELEKADTLLGGLQVRAELGYAYGRSGKRKEAQQQLEYLMELSTRDSVAPATIASIYAGLGNKDQALQWLSKACDQQHGFGVYRLKADPQWDSLRSDKRFQDLLRRIGLG
jgi:tetratricopeptide (TPR) repeat protein